MIFPHRYNFHFFHCSLMNPKKQSFFRRCFPFRSSSRKFTSSRVEEMVNALVSPFSHSIGAHAVSLQLKLSQLIARSFLGTRQHQPFVCLFPLVLLRRRYNSFSIVHNTVPRSCSARVGMRSELSAAVSFDVKVLVGRHYLILKDGNQSNNNKKGYRFLMPSWILLCRIK